MWFTQSHCDDPTWLDEPVCGLCRCDRVVSALFHTAAAAAGEQLAHSHGAGTLW